MDMQMLPQVILQYLTCPLTARKNMGGIVIFFIDKSNMTDCIWIAHTV